MVSSSQAALPWLDRSVTATGPAQTLKASSPEGPRFHPFGEDGLSFLDLIDVVNPLHHIPVVGPMYREITGDVINPLPRITDMDVAMMIGEACVAENPRQTARDALQDLLGLLGVAGIERCLGCVQAQQVCLGALAAVSVLEDFIDRGLWCARQVVEALRRGGAARQ